MAIASAVRTAQVLGRRDFLGFQRLIYEQAGITMSDAKQPLVCGRLSKRLAQLNIDDFGTYLALVQRDATECQVAVDLLTTNETYFFREPRHFDFLLQAHAQALRAIGQPRVWCAASSTGEEPYTLAIVLAEVLGHTRFEILASDISTRVLQRARHALYPLEDAAGIPRALRMRWCLKGVDTQAGWFTLDPTLTSRVQFAQINLNETLPDIGDFDLVFIRNVMIYFSQATRQAVMERVVPRLRPGGHLFISHSETLHSVTDALRSVQPSVYVHR